MSRHHHTRYCICCYCCDDDVDRFDCNDGGDCSYGDCNFANCATPDADELDTDGHCHGSDDDSTYGWWVRDHHFRGYTGTLNCCCG